MNDAIIDDLKQFISAAILQSTAEIREDIADLKGDVSDLKTDVSELKTDVAQLKIKVSDMDIKLDAVMEATGERFADHEQRITRLETRTA